MGEKNLLVNATTWFILFYYIYVKVCCIWNTSKPFSFYLIACIVTTRHFFLSSCRTKEKIQLDLITYDIN